MKGKLVLLVALALGYILGSAQPRAQAKLRPRLHGPIHAAKMVGDDGYLMGYDVTVDGENVCSDPWVSVGSREIECSN